MHFTLFLTELVLSSWAGGEIVLAVGVQVSEAFHFFNDLVSLFSDLLYLISQFFLETEG